AIETFLPGPEILMVVINTCQENHRVPGPVSAEKYGQRRLILCPCRVAIVRVRRTDRLHWCVGRRRGMFLGHGMGGQRQHPRHEQPEPCGKKRKGRQPATANPKACCGHAMLHYYSFLYCLCDEQ